LMNKLA
jgi:hypothetical protein